MFAKQASIQSLGSQQSLLDSQQSLGSQQSLNQSQQSFEQSQLSQLFDTSQSSLSSPPFLATSADSLPTIQQQRQTTPSSGLRNLHISTSSSSGITTPSTGGLMSSQPQVDDLGEENSLGVEFTIAPPTPLNFTDYFNSDVISDVTQPFSDDVTSFTSPSELKNTSFSRKLKFDGSNATDQH
jgi:hypothetical protein